MPHSSYRCADSWAGVSTELAGRVQRDRFDGVAQAQGDWESRKESGKPTLGCVGEDYQSRAFLRHLPPPLQLSCYIVSCPAGDSVCAGRTFGTLGG